MNETGVTPPTLVEEIARVIAESGPIDESLHPDDQIKEGEKVIGTLPDPLRRLFAYFRRRGNLLLKEVEAIDFEKLNGDTRKRLAAQKRDAEITKELFWASVRDFFNTDSATIGIRQGWQIVSIPEEEKCGCPLCRGGLIGIVLPGSVPGAFRL